jgi:predicted nucleotidyltransferase component of viral defense system
MKITKAHITRQASSDGVPARTVERDYALAHAVASIALADQGRHLVFKGGTSLRFIHFEDYRYSADLDFSIVGVTNEEGLTIVRKAFATHGAEGPQLQLTDDDPPRIAYVGPLGRERTIKLDLADDEHIVHTERRPLLSRWSDVPEVEIRAYTVLEITGEKLRCVLQRLQCRDLFDLDVLFERSAVDVSAAAELFRVKAEHRGFDPLTFDEKYRTRVIEYEKRWEQELLEHVPGQLPPFRELERRVSRHLRAAGLLRRG